MSVCVCRTARTSCVSDSAVRVERRRSRCRWSQCADPAQELTHTSMRGGFGRTAGRGREVGASRGDCKTLLRLPAGIPVTPLKVEAGMRARWSAEIRRRQQKCCAQSGSVNPSAGERARSVSLSGITFHSSGSRLRGNKTCADSSRRGRRDQRNDLDPAGTVPEKKHGSDARQAGPAGTRAPLAEAKR